MAESGSLWYSSETDDDYNLSLSNSLRPRVVTRYTCRVHHYKWKCGLTTSSKTYHLLPCLLMAVIPMMSSLHYCFWVFTCLSCEEYWLVSLLISIRWLSLHKLFITKPSCIIHYVLVIGTLVVAVRSWLQKESWFVVMRWSK